MLYVEMKFHLLPLAISKLSFHYKNLAQEVTSHSRFLDHLWPNHYKMLYQTLSYLAIGKGSGSHSNSNELLYFLL